MMMSQILNILNIVSSLALVAEVLYLFTCGQLYMKVNVIRNRRSFSWERYGYLSVAVFSIINIFYGKGADICPVLMITSFSFLLMRKCYSVMKKRGKPSLNLRFYSKQQNA